MQRLPLPSHSSHCFRPWHVTLCGTVVIGVIGQKQIHVVQTFYQKNKNLQTQSLLQTQGQTENQSGYPGSWNKDQVVTSTRGATTRGGKWGGRKCTQDFPSSYNRRALLSSLSLPQGSLSVWLHMPAQRTGVCFTRKPLACLCPYQCGCTGYLRAAQGSLSLCFWYLSLTDLHGLQGVKLEQDRRAPEHRQRRNLLGHSASCHLCVLGVLQWCPVCHPGGSVQRMCHLLGEFESGSEESVHTGQGHWWCWCLDEKFSNLWPEPL